MILHVTGPAFEWRGPAPYVFVALDPHSAEAVSEIRHAATYGWGVIPATISLGDTTWQTSLFPKDGTFLVPVKKAVQLAEGVALGDEVSLVVAIDL